MSLIFKKPCYNVYKSVASPIFIYQNYSTILPHRLILSISRSYSNSIPNQPTSIKPHINTPTQKEILNPTSIANKQLKINTPIGIGFKKESSPSNNTNLGIKGNVDPTNKIIKGNVDPTNKIIKGSKYPTNTAISNKDQKGPLKNEAIPHSITELLVITETGENKGKLSRSEALLLKSSTHDLVLLKTSPPVARLMPIQSKSKPRTLPKSKVKSPSKHKELVVKSHISLHDLEIKLRKVIEFLTQGERVLFTIQYLKKRLVNRNNVDIESVLREKIKEIGQVISVKAELNSKKLVIGCLKQSK